MGIYTPNDVRELQAVNEVYFGELPHIQKMQTLITKIRAKLNPINISKVNKFEEIDQFNRIVENNFGFKRFSLTVIYSKIYNAYTFPISSAIDVLNEKDKLYSSSSNGFYFKDNKYCVLTYISSGLLLDRSVISDREVMAIILHEIGHSFTNAVYSKSIFGAGYKILNFASMLEKSIINISLNSKQDTQVSDLLTDVSAVTIYSTNFFRNITTNINLYIKKEMPIIYEVDNILKLLNGYIGDAFTEVMTLFSKILSFSIIPRLGWALLGRLIYNGFIDTLFLRKYRYRNEQLSDNFATVYGYGEDMASGITHLSMSSHGSDMEKVFRSAPLLNSILDLPNTIASFLFYPITTHPLTISRVDNQLQMLRNELNRSDIDPLMKDEIKEQIKSIEELIEREYKQGARSNVDPDKLEKGMQVALYTIFKGDYRDKGKVKSYDLMDNMYQDSKNKK